MVFGPLRSRVDVFDDDDDIGDWMARRNAQLAAQQAAEAAGREAWNQATQTGQDVAAATPHDLLQLGAQTLRDVSAGGDAAQPAESSPSVEAIQPVEPDGPLTTPPNLRFATARSGDSISKLVGTSDPAAVGRFLSLNGMDPSSSTILAGQSYAVPTQFDDVSGDDVAAGARTLQADNSRLAALQAQRAAAQAAGDQWQRRFDAGQNVFTGDGATTGVPPSAFGRAQPVGSYAHDFAAPKEAFWNGYVDGLLPGVLRAGVHAAEGLSQAAAFGLRLDNPSLDRVISAPGHSAFDQVMRAGSTAGLAVAQAVVDPSSLSRGAKTLARNVNVELNPLATPLPSTPQESYQRGEHVSENDAELLANVAATPVGGELGATIEGMKYAGEAGDVTKYLQAGFPLEQAKRLAAPYKGMAHHTWGRKRMLPAALGGGLLPDWLSESPLNRLQPRGIDFGQMYDLHHAVDPHFYGARLPGAGKGQGWSGRRRGLEKYGPDGQLWHGVPGLTKGLAAGTLLDLGDGASSLSPQEDPQ